MCMTIDITSENLHEMSALFKNIGPYSNNLDLIIQLYQEFFDLLFLFMFIGGHAGEMMWCEGWLIFFPNFIYQHLTCNFCFFFQFNSIPPTLAFYFLKTIKKYFNACWLAAAKLWQRGPKSDQTGGQRGRLIPATTGKR